MGFRGISWNSVEFRGIPWNFVEFRGGMLRYCDVMIGAVLPWKERIFRLQLQFSLRAMWESIAVM